MFPPCVTTFDLLYSHRIRTQYHLNDEDHIVFTPPTSGYCLLNSTCMQWKYCYETPFPKCHVYSHGLGSRSYALLTNPSWLYFSIINSKADVQLRGLDKATCGGWSTVHRPVSKTDHEWKSFPKGHFGLMISLYWEHLQCEMWLCYYGNHLWVIKRPNESNQCNGLSHTHLVPIYTRDQ